MSVQDQPSVKRAPTPRAAPAVAAAQQWHQPSNAPAPAMAPAPAFGSGWGNPSTRRHRSPDRRPRRAPGRRAAPAALVVGGVALMVGSVTPWPPRRSCALGDGHRVSRHAGDGWLTLTLGALLAGAGAALCAWRGRKALSITSTVLGGDRRHPLRLRSHSPLHRNGQRHQRRGGTVTASVSIGFGLVLATLAPLSLGAAIAPSPATVPGPALAVPTGGNRRAPAGRLKWPANG